MMVIVGLIVIAGLSASNINTLSSARKVKVGMITDSLTSIMGKPFQIEINSDGEYWHYKYTKSWSADINIMRVKIDNDTVQHFNSY